MSEFSQITITIRRIGQTVTDHLFCTMTPRKKQINLPRLIRRHNIPYLVTRVEKQLQKKSRQQSIRNEQIHEYVS